MANVPAGDARYLALTTYGRDGRPVTTPVWAAPLDGKLYVVTAKSTGKARGVRATGRVRFAASNMSGRQTLSEWQEGAGSIVELTKYFQLLRQRLCGRVDIRRVRVDTRNCPGPAWSRTPPRVAASPRVSSVVRVLG
jgi:PPOX class probable F420-dependent enzyme